MEEISSENISQSTNKFASFFFRLRKNPPWKLIVSLIILILVVIVFFIPFYGQSLWYHWVGSPDGNLLRNSGFEISKKGMPAGWTTKTESND